MKRQSLFNSHRQSRWFTELQLEGSGTLVEKVRRWGQAPPYKTLCVLGALCGKSVHSAGISVDREVWGNDHIWSREFLVLSFELAVGGGIHH